MRPRAALALAALLGMAAAQAQPYWKRLGRGTAEGTTQFHAIHGDSILDRLLAGGSFMHLLNDEDTVLCIGQAAWNGHRWDSLATRVQPIAGNTAQPTAWFIRSQGRLYASGFFTLEYAPGQYSRSMAVLNEAELRWEPIACPLPSWNSVNQLVPKFNQSQLYVTGYRDDPCGMPVRTAFKYNPAGFFEEWPPFAELSDDPSDYVGLVFEFQGMVHVTGTLFNMFGNWANFIRYNGTAWEPVPGWAQTSGPIKDVSIRNDTLYVCGAFKMSQGAPGNLIARFDGANWDSMGQGLRYTVVPNGEVALDMHWWRGDLYVGGVFDRADGLPTMGLAVWKGNRWCTLPGEFNLHNSQPPYADIQEITTWRDSLYLIGSFNSIDGEAIRQVAQWIGGDAVRDCGAPVGVAEHAQQQLRISPLDDDGRFNLGLPAPRSWQIELFDALGKRIGSQRVNDDHCLIDLSAHAPGAYLLRATEGNGQALTAKLIRP